MKLFCLGALLVVAATAAQATANRTFVSSTGLDTNSCSRTDPCRSFTAAIGQTTAGGEVIAIDSAGYGIVSVLTSVSIVAPDGIYAGITVTPGNAGVLLVTGNTDTVLIRGLTINGLGANSTSGIQVNNVGTLYVQHVLMENLEFGLWAVPSSNALVRIDDSTAVHCAEAGASFQNLTAGQTTRASLFNSRFEDDFTGVDAGPRSIVNVEKSVVVGNGNVGFFSSSATGDLTVDDCVASHNGYGFVAAGLVRVARTLIVKNQIGVQQNQGGFLYSWGDNHLAGNIVDGTFPLSIARQ